MALELKCKLIDKLSVQNGESARGAWSKQDFVVETKIGRASCRERVLRLV